MSPRSFRVEVTMQHGIAIVLFLLKRDGLKSRGGGEGGAALRNDVTHHVLCSGKMSVCFNLQKSRNLECTKIDILQFTPESITDKICSS